MCLCACVGGCARPSCDVRLVSALHRWVYLAARRACNLATFIPLSLFSRLSLPPAVSCFALLIESSAVDHNDSEFVVCEQCRYSLGM